ncbi:DciA family protein [Streptomyces beigongshangae]|uniref:DciA family protein n=1 Tax=Streptomyces beigongshangae TaxID=2841597 RepID=UPI001C85C4BB|nr:DciA family protein [Streptomyces sp. REN17]
MISSASPLHVNRFEKVPRTVAGPARRASAGRRRGRGGDRISTELSGVDLACQALIAAREAAEKNGALQTKKPKRRTGTSVRRDGREPLGLGALVTERAWELPAAGATLRDRWAAVTPELAGHAAVSYDPDSGQLTVCPDSTAWATRAVPVCGIRPSPMALCHSPEIYLQYH